MHALKPAPADAFFPGSCYTRLMRQSTQHHMAEMIRLFFDCRSKFRMFVSMNHAPPGRNRIDQFLIFCIQIHTIRIYNVIRFFHCFHLFIRIPDHAYTSSYNAIRFSTFIASPVSPSFTFANVGSPVIYSHINMLSSSITSLP